MLGIERALDLKPSVWRFVLGLILRIRRINLCKVRGRVRAGGGNLLGDEISLVRLVVYLYYYTQGSRTFELILVIWAPPRVADQSLATSGETLLVL